MTMHLESAPKPEGVNQDFLVLMQRVREGSEEAAWELIDRYGHHILRAVRRMLHEKMRSRFDSVDFVQAVWASFFTSRTQLMRFDKPEQLVAFLATLARNKVVDETRRRLNTQMRDPQRELRFHEKMAVDSKDASVRQDTPSQIAVARERWNRLLDGQPEHYRQILCLRYAGETFEQIAAKVGMDERSVRKVIDKLKQE